MPNSKMMLNPKIWSLIICLSGIHPVFSVPVPDDKKDCLKPFIIHNDGSLSPDTVKVCMYPLHTPTGYRTTVNMAVCEDKLCARVILDVKWDLAGNYSGFDTLHGNPLTKFDHKPFTGEDYKKLDQILKDRNSRLQSLEKDELTDKSTSVKASSVDAVTSATPATIKKVVVDGAVYTSWALWHLVNGPLCDTMRVHTRSVYSDEISNLLLESENYESQLFALRLMTISDFENRISLIFRVLKKSNPLVRAYIIHKIQLPLGNPEKNLEFVKLYPGLDPYSKSIFLDRILSSGTVAEVFIPLVRKAGIITDQKQLLKLDEAADTFLIPK